MSHRRAATATQPSPNVFAETPSLGVIEVSGADAHAFLQTKLTCDTRTWADTGGGAGFAVDINGKLIAEAWWSVDGARVFGVTRAARVAALVEHLDRYVIMEDVAVADRSAELSVRWVCGALTVDAPPSRIAHIGDREIVTAQATYSRDAWWLIEEGDGAATADVLRAAGFSCIDEDTLSAMFVVDGVAWGDDEWIASKTIPIEAGGWHGISFTKGCYLGQEVIERLVARGAPARRLMRLTLDADAAVVAGTSVRSGDAEAGRVTRVATSEDGVIALAWIKRKFLDQALTVDGAVAHERAYVGGESEDTAV